MDMRRPQGLPVGHQLLFCLCTGILAQVSGKSTVSTNASSGVDFRSHFSWVRRRQPPRVNPETLLALRRSPSNWLYNVGEHTAVLCVSHRNMLLQATRNYELEFTASYTMYRDHRYFGPETSVSLVGPNKLEIVLDILQTLPADLKSVYHGFEKNGRNEYVPSLGYRGTVCDDLYKEIHNVPMFACLRFSSIGVKECPFKKGTYSGTNLRCSAADGPVMAPGKYWRLNMTWVTKDNSIILWRNVEFTVIRKTTNGRPPKY